MLIHSAREGCLYALKAFWKDGTFLADSFQQIRTSKKIENIDLQLSQEIAFGVVRRFYTLDAILKNFLKDQKIKLKIDAKLLLKMAVYQLVFMDKVPIYAVVFESVELSKKYCPYQSGFINNILRKLTTILPIRDIQNSLSEEEFYSLPKNYIEKIKVLYPDQSLKILEASIQRPKMTYLALDASLLPQDTKEIGNTSILKYFPLKKDQKSISLFEAKTAYIQNPTPGILMEFLSVDSHPKSLLDLCSAPGGKLILSHILFPSCQLFANEISKERIVKLSENLRKYHIQAVTLNQDGTNIQIKQKFDLIIIDAPCSNSGVLHKKPEAKFRLDSSSIEELKNTQSKLLDSAKDLLNPNGEIFYLTCSILKEENDDIVNSFISANSNFTLKSSKLILPDLEYLDGGFCAKLQRNS